LFVGIFSCSDIDELYWYLVIHDSVWNLYFMFLQGVMSSAPDIIGNTLHAHHDHGSSGHHHGIDLEHPVLALSMTTLAISIKEG